MLTQMYVKAMVYLASLKNEEGQGMAEYGLILAGIAVIVMATIWTLGGDINTKFSEIATQFDAAP